MPEFAFLLVFEKYGRNKVEKIKNVQRSCSISKKEQFEATDWLFSNKIIECAGTLCNNTAWIALLNIQIYISSVT